MLELGEDEGGADDLCNASGAGGGVLEDGPSLAEQGEPAFSLEAEAAQEGVPGAGAGGEFLVSAGVFHGDVDAGSGSFVAAVGEGRHSEGRGAVEGGQDMDPGGGDVVDVAGLGLGGPQREAVGAHDGLDVAAGAVVLAGIPGVDFVALHAGDLLGDAVGGEQLAVEDHEGDALLPGSFQGLVQVRGLRGENLGALVDVAVRGGAGDAVVVAELLDPGAVAEPAQDQDRLLTSGQGPAAGRGAPQAAFGDQQAGDEAKQLRGHV